MIELLCLTYLFDLGSGLSRVDTITIVEALATGCVGTTVRSTSIAFYRLYFPLAHMHICCRQC